MKTSIKILLLVLFSIGAIAGVLIYAKTKADPPSDLEQVNQYVINLDKATASYSGVSDYEQSHQEYIKLDDMLNLLLAEDHIDSETADNYRRQIDETYGNVLTTHGFGILRNSVWPDDDLSTTQERINQMLDDRLSDHSQAASASFIAKANEFNTVVSDYKAALYLAKNSSYKGLVDAQSKIAQANKYKQAPYLQNNTALVSALDALPGKIAKNHHDYVRWYINDILSDYSVSFDNYFNTQADKVNSKINEYKNTNIYGSSKPSYSDLDNLVNELFAKAERYYGTYY